MHRFPEEEARKLFELLVTEIASNARIAAALRLENAERHMKLALKSVTSAFAERYGQPLLPDDYD